MKTAFSKYHGAGNDFVIIDNRQNTFTARDQSTIQAICDRRFGIGADGLMLLEEHPDHDFLMVYYNADGLEGSMCGNGGRCIVAFASHLGIIKSSASFLATDGPHQATISESKENKMTVSLQMTDVERIRSVKDGFFLDTGSPHLIIFEQDIESLEVATKGKELRHDPAFSPGGTNVNFVEIKNDQIYIRTYERGVEAETLACGTGVTAAAIASFYAGKLVSEKNIVVHAMGGRLKVSFSISGNEKFTDVYLEGPAEKVFDGSIDL